MQRNFLMSSALCVSLCVWAAAPAYAHAQEADGATDEIVVTARKRVESLQDVPASIQVVGEAEIKALNVSSLSDLNGTTPNASIGSGSGRNSGSITIRGISSNVRNAGFESGAAVYVDSVYQGRPAGNDQDLVDIERVEILRGPQGTLYGKNTTAGAFNLTTVSPGDKWTGKAFVRFGSRQEMQGAAYVSGPLIADMLGVKLGIYRRLQDGHQRDLNTGDVYGNTDSFGLRGQVRLTPGEWTIDLRGDYYNDYGNGSIVEPVTSPAVIPGRDTIASNIHQTRGAKGGGASLTISRDTGIGQITSISSWRKLNYVSSEDDDYYVLHPVFVTVSHEYTDKARHHSQELRLTSLSSGPFSYVAGLFYFSQVTSGFRPFEVFGIPEAFFDKVEVGTKSYAAYANVDYKVSDDLTLTAGLRYTAENKNIDFEQKGFAPIAIPNIPRGFDKFSDTDLSPTASIKYKFTPDIMGYVTVSRGFKSGGWNPDITKLTSIAALKFDSEKVTNYEAGLRTQFLDRRVTLNLTGYHMDYGNLQVSQFLGQGGFVITNAGSAVINGAELEFAARPVDGFNLRAGGAYNDAHYTKFDSAPPGGSGTPVSYAGQQFTNVPKFSAYVSGDVTVPVDQKIDLTLHADYRYQSKIYFDDARTVQDGLPFAQNGYGVLNGRIGLQTSNGLELSLYAQNITNKRFLTTRQGDFLTGSIVVDAYNAPRTVGVRIGASF